MPDPGPPSFRQTVGSAYSDLGLFAEAQQQMQRALDLRRRVLGPEHPDTLSSMYALGELYVRAGKFEPAEALLKEGFQEADVRTGIKIFGAKGCQACTDGYKGRVGIYQVMPVTEAVGRIIMEGGNAIDIADQAAKEGVWDLRRAGLEKVKQGMTSIEEVNSVTIE